MYKILVVLGCFSVVNVFLALLLIASHSTRMFLFYPDPDYNRRLRSIVENLKLCGSSTFFGPLGTLLLLLLIISETTDWKRQIDKNLN